MISFLLILLIRITVSTTPKCLHNICLTWYEDNHELVLVCEIPQLYHQVVFINPTNIEYAFCVSPYPTSACFLNIKIGMIYQDLRMNQTMLKISTSKQSLTILNGIWTCSHGTKGEVAMANVTLSSKSGISFGLLPVFLQGDIKDGTLTMTCKVDILSFEVLIINPQREIVGKCKAPVRENTLYGDCTTNNTEQYFETNVTKVTINITDNRSIQGTWNCTLGTNRGFDTFNVVSFLNEEEYDQGEHCKGCAMEILVSIIVCTVVSLVLFAYKLRWYEKLKYYGAKARRQSLGNVCEPYLFLSTPENEEDLLHHGSCNTCGNFTAFAFCSTCKRFHCETCYKHHIKLCPGHTLLQVEHISISNHSTKCMECGENNPVRICVNCEQVFCDVCSSEHIHKSTIKSLLVKSADMTKGCPKCESKGNECVDIHTNITIPQDRIPIRICGLSVLPYGRMVVADSNNRKIKIFNEDGFEFDFDLNAEPRGMTLVYDNKVAITFPHEQQIQMIKITDSNLELPVESFDIHEYGKPFSIAYNQEHFAVEMSECENGYIAILDLEFNCVTKITNVLQYGYFTGHTIRLALNKADASVYISAMSKCTVTCVNYEGVKKWCKQFPSPRGLVFVQGINLSGMNLFLASKRGNAIYQINQSNGSSKILFSSGKIISPRYISYNQRECLLYVQVMGEDDDDKIIVLKYNI